MTLEVLEMNVQELTEFLNENRDKEVQVIFRNQAGGGDEDG